MVDKTDEHMHGSVSIGGQWVKNVPGGVGKVGMRLADELPPVETWGKAYG